MKERFKYEQELYDKGIKLIGGIDEVGRGPLVGPVVAALVILPKDFYDKDIKDSKKLSEKERNRLYNVIMNNAISVSIGTASNDEIDEINIYEATKKAMKRAIKFSKVKPDHLLIDAMNIEGFIPCTPIIKGDDKSISIAAASIVAKVTRDALMYELDKKYPMYGFCNNKGYGTPKHLEAIKKYGIIKEHRKSFNRVN